MSEQKDKSPSNEQGFLIKLTSPVVEFVKGLTYRDYLALILAILVGILGIYIFKGIRFYRLKMWLSMIAMALLIIAWIIDRVPKLKWAKVFATALIAALTLTSVVLITKGKFEKVIKKSKGKRVISKNIGLVRTLHAWNMFHYMINSKYFDELGYFNLYKAAILSDREEGGRKYFVNAPYIRDMHTYKFVPLQPALEQALEENIKGLFTESRWEEFKNDIVVLQKFRPKHKWHGPIADRGFNPSPAWLALHYPLLNSIEISRPKVLKVLATIQVYLFILAFLFALWAFGPRTALIGATWIILFFGNEARILGGYMPYDWFILIVIAAALYKKRKYFASAPVLAFTAMMRGFPGLLALHSAFRWLKELITKRRPHRAQTRFLATLVAACLIFVFLGGITDHGLNAWLEWKEKISIHSAHHGHSYNRLGLKYLFAKDYSTDKWTISVARRDRVILENEPIYRGVQVFLLLILFAALYKRKRYDGFVMGFIAAYFGMLLSRYYFSAGVLLFTLGATDKFRLGNLITSVYLFAIIVFFYWHDNIPKMSPYKTWYIVNISFTIYCFGLLTYFIAKDVYDWRKRKIDAETPGPAPVGERLEEPTGS